MITYDPRMADAAAALSLVVESTGLTRRPIPPGGSMSGMARQKATVTLDRDKVEEARVLIGGQSMSEVIDVALDRLIRTERLRRDVEAYTRRPQDRAELGVADLAVTFDLDDDEVDYDALYGGSP